jgi:hypothetical protein
VFGVIVLFLGLAIAPSTGTITENHCSINDSIEHSGYVMKSDTQGVDLGFLGTLGDNGWYTSCVHIIFTWSSDVAKIWFYIDGGDWIEYSEPFGPICKDGLYTVCWRYMDVHGNISDIECKELMIDQTPPGIELWWEAYLEYGLWWIVFTAMAEDECSGMNGVDFYLNDILKESIVGSGPIYVYEIPFVLENYSIIGFICNRETSEENISFFALIVETSAEYSFAPWEDFVTAVAYDNAGNWDYDETYGHSPPPSRKFFTHFTFTNDYRGYIGRFFIFAKFENGPL